MWGGQFWPQPPFRRLVSKFVREQFCNAALASLSIGDHTPEWIPKRYAVTREKFAGTGLPHLFMFPSSVFTR
ncbi:MAG: hypothetical protein C5B51_00585 [Terriglobia bacterium]|nr:MAG: hypothetical protein C5B51_00585 [Terriglobia bacterium]